MEKKVGTPQCTREEMAKEGSTHSQGEQLDSGGAWAQTEVGHGLCTPNTRSKVQTFTARQDHIQLPRASRQSCSLARGKAFSAGIAGPGRHGARPSPARPERQDLSGEVCFLLNKVLASAPGESARRGSGASLHPPSRPGAGPGRESGWR